MGDSFSMSGKNILAVIGALALIVLFRTQLLQIINLIAQTAATPPGGGAR
jgi:hypothetical protein